MDELKRAFSERELSIIIEALENDRFSRGRYSDVADTDYQDCVADLIAVFSTVYDD